MRGGGDDGFGEPGTDVGFAADTGGVEIVDGEARDDGGEKGAGCADLVRGGLLPAEVGFLDEVFGVGRAAGHAVGEREEVLAVLREGVYGLDRFGLGCGFHLPGMTRLDGKT